MFIIGGGGLFFYAKYYWVAEADMAFVVTGKGGESKAIVDGGAFVIPMFHKMKCVPLNTIRLDISRTGEDALITNPDEDSLRADVKAEFYVKVEKKAEDVIKAASSLGDVLMDPRKLMELVENKFVGALRTVVGKQTLQNLHAKRDEFTEDVQRTLKDDLEKNGLTLETVTISVLDQTPESFLHPEENVFDARGARTLMSVTKKQEIERNLAKVDAEKQIAKQDLERDQEINKRKAETAKSEAETEFEIAREKTWAESQSKTVKAEQERIAEEARLNAELLIKKKEIENARVAQVAEEEKRKAVQQAEISANEAQEVAEQQRLVAVAGAQKEQQEAETMRLVAERARVTASEELKTAQAVEIANRAKKESLIAEGAEAEKAQLKDNMAVDVQAYKVKTTAKAEMEAAENRATAKLREADASRQAALYAAEGRRAETMVPVEVDRAQAEIDRSRLEMQEEFSQIAFQKEIQLAAIEAQKQEAIAMAEAAGKAFAGMDMKVYGSPDTVISILEAFKRGRTQGEYLTALAESTPVEVKELVTDSANRMGLIVMGIAKKFGVDLTPGAAAALISELTDADPTSIVKDVALAKTVNMFTQTTAEAIDVVAEAVSMNEAFDVDKHSNANSAE